jgi:diguanylate cyclase (GGDEF)-like protein/PAS domain S-box-containing protein
VYPNDADMDDLLVAGDRFPHYPSRPATDVDPPIEAVALDGLDRRPPMPIGVGARRAPVDSTDARGRGTDGHGRHDGPGRTDDRGPRDAMTTKGIGTATHIGDARQAEADLRRARRATAEALALLEMLQSTAPVGFGFVDREFRLVRLNETLAAVNGATVAEHLGLLVADVVPDLWPQLEPLYHHVLDQGEAVLDMAVEGPAPGAPTVTRHWLTSLYPVSLDNEVLGIGVVVVDITERKAGEAARQQLAAIIEGSGDAIFGATTDGMVTSWNAAAERLFGYAAEEVTGQPVSVLAPADRADEQTQMRARLIAGGPPERVETVRRRRDGSLVDVLVTASTATDERGDVLGLSVIAHDITERRQAQQALEASQRRLAVAQRIAHLGSFELDLVTGEMTWSEEHFRILGLDPALPATSDLFISKVHPDDLPGLGGAWENAVGHGVPFDRSYRIIRADGEQRWVQARAVPEMAADGAVIRLIGTLMDDTERVEAERAGRLAETRFEIGFEQSAIGATIADLEGFPTRVNPALCSLLGRPADRLIGRQWIDYTHPDEVPLRQAVLARVAAGHDTYQDQRRYLHSDGTVVWVSSHVTLVRDDIGEPQYFFTQFEDISGAKRLEHELAHQALHDSLTGLPNRALLADRLAHGLAGARRRHTRLGVLFLDVDHFKEINDSLGHTCGDDLLGHAALRIAGAIRAGDTVARFGGDEFVVVCDDVGARQTEEIGERILDALSQPLLIADQEVNLTASLGIAIADDGATPESLLRDSDFAMYRAKERGRGRIELFDEALRSKAERRLATATALHRALARDEFVLHYQPVVDLSTGAMASAEALLRWEHPDGVLVSPDEFIPLTESTGLIVPIGAWVLEQACRQLAGWRRTLPSMSVAVNVSVRQLLPGFAELVQDVLTRTGTCAGDLYLEMTESVLMDDVDYYGKTLDDLKALGVHLSIDDFGTGYSSLSYLKRFPVDAVKVDRAFVDGLGTDPHDTALVAAIVAMAGALDLEVTAEGVETPEQLAHLQRLHCARAQGYYLARPMPAAALTDLVAEHRRWPVA